MLLLLLLLLLLSNPVLPLRRPSLRRKYLEQLPQPGAVVCMVVRDPDSAQRSHGDARRAVATATPAALAERAAQLRKAPLAGVEEKATPTLRDRPRPPALASAAVERAEQQGGAAAQLGRPGRARAQHRHLDVVGRARVIEVGAIALVSVAGASAGAAGAAAAAAVRCGGGAVAQPQVRAQPLRGSGVARSPLRIGVRVRLRHRSCVRRHRFRGAPYGGSLYS
jgi:hypothetical protein